MPSHYLDPIGGFDNNSTSHARLMASYNRTIAGSKRLAASRPPVVTGTEGYADRTADTPSRFDQLMRSGTPSPGGGAVEGSWQYYMNQRSAQNRGDLVRGDLGIDEYGNPQDLQPLNLPDAPTYTAPEVDEGAIAERTRSNLAPMLSRLRRALSGAITSGRNVENLNVRKALTRGAVSGYGEGLSEASAGARRTGREDYLRTEFQPKVQAAQLNYRGKFAQHQATVQDMINRRSAAMNTYQSRRRY